jgi:hypothetical protein
MARLVSVAWKPVVAIAAIMSFRVTSLLKSTPADRLRVDGVCGGGSDCTWVVCVGSRQH